jgi:hypothetical protein
MASVPDGVDGVTKVTANRPARVTDADEMAVQTRPIAQFLHIRATPPAAAAGVAEISATGQRSFEGDERHPRDSRPG